MHPHILPILIGTAILLFVLAIPLTLGVVPRNQWYGVRARQTMRGTETARYAIDRKGGAIVLSLAFTALVLLAGFALL
jgi:hypothetical protein